MKNRIPGLFINFILLSVCIIQAQETHKTFHSFDKSAIAYIDEGEGEPVILIHGFISTGASWQKTAVKKELLNQGYRVIIPDLRGNGNSAKSHQPSFYDHDAEISDISALADHLKLSSYIAIGYSRGAIVLAKLLVTDQRISKAVMGGMGLDFTDPNWDRRMMFQKAFSGEELPNEVTKGAVEYAKSIGADLKILGLLQEFQPVTSIAQLQEIKTPVLVIAGDQDIDNGSPQALQENIKNATLIIVPGDHNGTYKTQIFADKVLMFLKS